MTAHIEIQSSTGYCVHDCTTLYSPSPQLCCNILCNFSLERAAYSYITCGVAVYVNSRGCCTHPSSSTIIRYSCRQLCTIRRSDPISRLYRTSAVPCYSSCVTTVSTAVQYSCTAECTGRLQLVCCTAAATSPPCCISTAPRPAYNDVPCCTVYLSVQVLA